MTDKEFWANAYLKAYDKFLDKLEYKDIDDIENKIDDICNIAATCADAALEFFEFNKEYMTKKEKKEISKKEHNKQSYR